MTATGFIGIAFTRNGSGAARQVVHYSLPDDRTAIQPKVK
jgi:hypothetical protein